MADNPCIKCGQEDCPQRCFPKEDYEKWLRKQWGKSLSPQTASGGEVLIPSVSEADSSPYHKGSLRGGAGGKRKGNDRYLWGDREHGPCLDCPDRSKVGEPSCHDESRCEKWRGYKERQREKNKKWDAHRVSMGYEREQKNRRDSSWWGKRCK